MTMLRQKHHTRRLLYLMVFYTCNVYVYNIETGERDIPCLIDIFIVNLVM